MRSLTPIPLLALVATLAVAGCSSSKDSASPAADVAQSPAAAVSGTRLRARFVVAGESRELIGFYDTARKEDCTFQYAEGEHMRCLPKAVAFNATGIGYTDPTCRTSVGSAPSSGCD